MRSRKALFLDRDGIINVNHGYVSQPQDIQFIDGIFALCKAALNKDYLIIVVTNQSGIARNYYSRDDFQALTRWIEHQFWRRGVIITHTFHCPHHPKQKRPFGLNCCCRKPRPGMITKAQRHYGIDLSRSILVGDSLSDIQCAQNAGVKKSVLFKANSIQYRPQLIWGCNKPYYQASDLKAVRQLL